MTQDDETWGGQFSDPPRRQQGAESSFFGELDDPDATIVQPRQPFSNDPNQAQSARGLDLPSYSEHHSNAEYSGDPYGGPQQYGGQEYRSGQATSAGRGGDYGGDLHDEFEVLRGENHQTTRRGINPILLFVLAAVGVAAIAIGFAVFTTLRSDKNDVASPTTTATTLATSTTTTIATTTTPTLPPNALDMRVLTPTFICDGTTQQLGVITRAAPDEQIDFTSPQASGIRPGTADAQGNLDFRWNCSPDQIGKVWELTATGAASGKTAVITFTGTSAEAAEPTTTLAPTTTLPPGPLEIVIEENPFFCDGKARPFAFISGLTPYAVVEFSSPQATGLRSGTADADGKMPARWSCTESQQGETWELTATEPETDRSIEFTIRGY